MVNAEERNVWGQSISFHQQKSRMQVIPSAERTIEGTLVPGMTGVYLSKAPPTPPSSTTPLKTPPSKSTTPAKLRKEGFEAVRVEEFTLRYYKEEFGYEEGIEFTKLLRRCHPLNQTTPKIWPKEMSR